MDEWRDKRSASHVSTCTLSDAGSVSFLMCLVKCVATVIGLGAVLMPKAFSEMGYLVSLAITTFYAMMTYVSICFLCRCSERTRAHSYEELSFLYFGSACARFTICMMILQLFSLLVACLRLPQDTIALMIPLPQAVDEVVKRGLIGGLLTLFIVVIGCVRALEQPSPILLISLVCFVVAFVVLCIEIGSMEQTTQWKGWDEPVDQKLFGGMGNVIVSYNFHRQLLTYQAEMKDPSRVYLL